MISFPSQIRTSFVPFLSQNWWTISCGTAVSALCFKIYRRVFCSPVNSWPLQGTVAVVTGGSRGIGRGIALELGLNGAKVYILGRSRSDNSKTDTPLPGNEVSGKLLSGTIDETAFVINQSGKGGTGVPIYVDCTSDASMNSAIQKISDLEGGKIDLLVNCAIMIRNDLKQTPPFWTQENEVYDSYSTVGPRSAYMLSKLCVPLLLKSNCHVPLIINISSMGSYRYLFNVAYGATKAALDRMSRDMNVDFRKANTNISIITLHPGIVQTERMEIHAKTFRKLMKINVSDGETERYTGRAVCSLVAYQNKKSNFLLQLSGKTRTCTQLANHLNFTDIDGRRPPDPLTFRFIFFHYIPVLLQSKFRSKK